MTKTEQATKDKVAALAIVRAVAETVKECGRAPEGILYAALMAKGCDFERYEQITRVLINTKLVRREGNELVWVGIPEEDKVQPRDISGAMYRGK